MVLRAIVRFILTILLLSVIGVGIFNYLKHFDENECSMTYMKQVRFLLIFLFLMKNKFKLS